MAALLASTLCLCVMPTASASGRTGGSIHLRWPVSAAAAVAVSIHEALAAAKKDVRRFQQRLRARSCGRGKCYAAADVAAAVAATRERVRAAIPKDALPLQAAVGAEIDRLTTLGAPSPPPVLQPVHMPPDPPEETYDAQQTDSMFQRVFRFLDEIGSYKSYTPAVEFKSDPSGALYDIQIADTSITRYSGSTNQREPAVWRGIYQGLARRPGYKDAAISLNLMNDKPRVTCTCTLYKTSAPLEQESTCRLTW